MLRSPIAGRRRVGFAIGAAAAVALVGAAGVWGPSARSALAASTAASATATVSVNAGSQVATVPDTGVGLNASTYDAKILDSAVPGLVKAAGVQLMRFPGGTESDQYNWKNNTDVLSGKTQAVNFDQFMTMASGAGTQAMITVNYGTGTTVGSKESPQETGPQIAADWVRYANVQHNYQVKYWEIGNEVYGNGTYGGSWEPDDHCGAVPSPSNPTTCGPAVYAQNVAAYIQAMKAVDPSIKIGVVLTAPGNWPDGVTSAGSPQPWNQTVLSALKGSVDFADVHWYPQNPSTVTPPGPTDAGLLSDTDQIPTMVSGLHTALSSFAGTANIPIMITETNSVSSNPGKQTLSTVNALYLEQDYLGWIANGVANVDWWQLHNGAVGTGDNGSSLFGTATYGEYGVLSDASCTTSNVTNAQVCEPAADTPFPAYNGLKLLGQFIHPADALVSATSTQSLVRAYASRSADGSLRVMLVNDDPSNSYTVNLGYSGFTPSPGAPTVSVLGGDGSTITTGTQGSATTQTVAPYSITLVSLSPGSSASPSASASGSPSASSSPSSSLSASASRSTGGGCHVTYAVQSQWPGGFTASVNLANTSSAAWSSWTVTFTFPGDQKVTQSWNTGSLTQTGQNVTAANATYNGGVPAGGSASFGFQGTWNSSNASPTSFAVNGMACD